MKYIIAVFTLFTLIIVVLVGCSNSQTPMVDEPTVVSQTKTSTVTAVPTKTVIPTTTQTLIPSPTATCDNSVLAKSGYDIADVCISFPRKDSLVVNFKYRIEESRIGKDTYISITIPPQCKDDGNQLSPSSYVAKNLTGEVEFTFKMTLEGVCTMDSVEFIFYSDPNRNTIFYREFVLQPYELVRDFPTVNSDNLKVDSFKFTAGSNWSGVFTFNYAISEEIPIPLEQYRMGIYGFGANGTCFFASMGPLIMQHSGEYSITMNLPQDFGGPNQNCLNGLDKFTYIDSYLSVVDMVVGSTIYHQALDLSYTVTK